MDHQETSHHMFSHLYTLQLNIRFLTLHSNLPLLQLLLLLLSSLRLSTFDLKLFLIAAQQCRDRLIENRAKTSFVHALVSVGAKSKPKNTKRYLTVGLRRSETPSCERYTDSLNHHGTHVICCFSTSCFHLSF